MKIKILLVTILCLSLVQSYSVAQQRQSGDSDKYRSLIPEEKQNLLKNVDVIANMQYGLRNDFAESEYLSSQFKMEQFRMEIKGWVSDRVFFRFRHRYTSAFEPQTMDKIIKGVDMAFLTFKINDKWQLSAGKQCADWGGIEFDMNPVYIYEYSDIVEMADNFLSGVQALYQINDNNSLGLQVLNSRTQSYSEIYGNDSIIGATTTEAKAPLAGVLTWRGSFGNFSTLYSYSLFTEAEGYFKNYFAFGNNLQLKKFNISYDFKLSLEDLDRTGIVSQTIPRGQYKYTLTNTVYMSHWAQVEYKFHPKWQLALVGFVDQAKWMGDEDPTKTSDNIRTAYGYIPTIEYMPWNDMDLKFFAGYVGRIYNYSDYAKGKVGAKDMNTGRLMFGLVSALKFL